MELPHANRSSREKAREVPHLACLVHHWLRAGLACHRRAVLGLLESRRTQASRAGGARMHHGRLRDLLVARGAALGGHVVESASRQHSAFVEATATNSLLRPDHSAIVVPQEGDFEGPWAACMGSAVHV